MSETYPPPIALRLWAPVLITALLLVKPVSATDQEPNQPLPPPMNDRGDMIDRLAAAGRQARDIGSYEKARQRFAEAESGATTPEAKSRLRFDLALTYQLEGESLGNDPRFLEKAIVLYDQVLETRPGSAATLCNQARVYARLGKWESADERYRKAAELAGPDQPFYQSKYADYLVERGDWARAAPLYEAVALARPRSTEAHEILLLHYRDADVTGKDPLSSYLAKLIASGQGTRAAEAALDLLEQTRSTPDLTGDAILLSLAASGLAASPLDPEALLESDLAKRLAALADHPSIGLGAGELLKLMRASRAPGNANELAARVVWWRSRPGWAGESDPPMCIPPEAMRSVLLSLGLWHERNGAAELAETHYRAAVALDPGRVDPAAIRRLIDLFVSQNQLGRVWGLLGEYQVELFAGKGRAYRSGELEKIYEFHSTLGTLYGYLASKGQRYWGDSGDVYSAIFQLEQAVEVGKKLDETAARSGRPGPIHLEAGVVEYLARAYEATGELDKSTMLRLESAERFEKAGNLRASRYVLTPVKLETLPESQRQKLRQLELERPDDPTLDPELRKKLILEKEKLMLEKEKLQVRPPGE